MFKKLPVSVVVCILLFLIFLGLSAGCQIEVSGAAGSKLFYPDNLGDKKVGDPRKPMFEGSGYTERHTSGGESNFSGFRGIKGGAE